MKSICFARKADSGSMRGSYKNWNALFLIRLTPLVGEKEVSLLEN